MIRTTLLSWMTPDGASKTRPLDLRRMFIGDEPPLFLVEVALRTTVLFVYTLLLLRLLGKRGVAQLSLFEVTIIIGLGSAVGDPMFHPDVPLLHGIVVISIIVLLYRVFMSLMRTNERFERFVEGEPICVVSEGRLVLDALEKERLSQQELFEILRANGVTQLGEVKCAYLEHSGRLSVFSYPPRGVRAGLPFVPPWDIERPQAFECGDANAPLGEYACMTCGAGATCEKALRLGPCRRCKGERWTAAVRSPLGDDVRGASDASE